MSALSIKVTEMEGAAGSVSVVTVTGFVPPCKEGNASIDSLRPTMERVAKDAHGDCVILDFLDADYSFGDHFGSLWISPLRSHNRSAIIVADSNTAATIKDLLGELHIPIVPTLRDALMLC